jgi:hypothetical protein
MRDKTSTVLAAALSEERAPRRGVREYFDGFRVTPSEWNFAATLIHEMNLCLTRGALAGGLSANQRCVRFEPTRGCNFLPNQHSLQAKRKRGP